MSDAKRLVAEIEDMARLTASETGRARFSRAVLAAIQRVPRDEFVPAPSRTLAWANRPLGIGYRQTISQPYIVALMTDLLELTPDATVLEIGTGSGYQAAILACLARQVVTIEVIDDLAREAQQRLARLGYHNVQVHCADGRAGWPLHAPYDAIIVTAAADDVPAALLTQLRVGGRLVIPLGSEFDAQTLFIFTKTPQGYDQKRVLDVRFVPLVADTPPSE